ncbi:MAG TPA: hypothetical protein VJI68_00955 [Candidatus Nanoarchaeia archaeon]|nr:hypothetical protein [Candidatus Nanoarchaeia archaeon]
MKVVKYLALILVIMLFIPFVNAAITINSFSTTKYNLGDGVLITGSVVQSTDLRVNLDLILSCGGSNSQLGAFVLNLKANKASDFSRYVTLPMDLKGSCKIIGELSELSESNSSAALEKQEFNAFEVSDQLNGNFESNSNSFQLGEELIIKGTVSKQNGQAVDGVAILSFIKNGKVLFLDTAKIDEGFFDFKKTLNNFPPGNYDLNIVAKDNFGNTKDFTGSLKLQLTGNLDIVANLNKPLYNPGETLSLKGYIASEKNKQLANLLVDFYFENQVVSKELSNNLDSFTVTNVIDGKAKSGNHNIKIIASDKEGNYIREDVQYSVKAIPTSLNVQTSPSNLNPGASLILKANVFDQAGDLIRESISVNIVDTKNKVKISKVVTTGVDSEVIIPKDALPGDWKIKASGLGLESESNFRINEYNKLDAKIVGENLVVENTGNVPYEGLLDIIGNDNKKNAKLKLGVGDTTEIKLGKLFEPGDYNIKLPTLDKVFDAVKITKIPSLFSSLTGRTISDSTDGTSFSMGKKALLFVFMIVLLGGFSFLILNKRRKKASQDPIGGNYLKNKRRLQTKLMKEEITTPKKPEFGKATQEDIDYWKKKVQDSFKEQEQKKTNDTFVARQKDSINQDRFGNSERKAENKSSDKVKPGLMNMFG